MAIYFPSDCKHVGRFSEEILEAASDGGLFRFLVLENKSWPFRHSPL
jgi:hypothetical protein